jgi:hypothetical protein
LPNLLRPFFSDICSITKSSPMGSLNVASIVSSNWYCQL